MHTKHVVLLVLLFGALATAAWLLRSTPPAPPRPAVDAGEVAPVDAGALVDAGLAAAAAPKVAFPYDLPAATPPPVEADLAPAEPPPIFAADLVVPLNPRVKHEGIERSLEETLAEPGDTLELELPPGVYVGSLQAANKSRLALRASRAGPVVLVQGDEGDTLAVRDVASVLVDGVFFARLASSASQNPHLSVDGATTVVVRRAWVDGAGISLQRVQSARVEQSVVRAEQTAIAMAGAGTLLVRACDVGTHTALRAPDADARIESSIVRGLVVASSNDLAARAPALARTLVWQHGWANAVDVARFRVHAPDLGVIMMAVPDAPSGTAPVSPDAVVVLTREVRSGRAVIASVSGVAPAHEVAAVDEAERPPGAMPAWNDEARRAARSTWLRPLAQARALQVRAGDVLPWCGAFGPLSVERAPLPAVRFPVCPVASDFGTAVPAGSGVVVARVTSIDAQGRLLLAAVAHREHPPAFEGELLVPGADLRTPEVLTLGDRRVPLPFVGSQPASAGPGFVVLRGADPVEPCFDETCGGGDDDEPPAPPEEREEGADAPQPAAPPPPPPPPPPPAMPRELRVPLPADADGSAFDLEGALGKRVEVGCCT